MRFLRLSSFYRLDLNFEERLRVDIFFGVGARLGVSLGGKAVKLFLFYLLVANGEIDLILLLRYRLFTLSVLKYHVC